MEVIKAIREENKLRQEDIANILKIKRATYTSYEIGRDYIPLKHLNTLCNYFNISLDYALALTKKKNYPKEKEEINYSIIPQRLKELRKDNGLTQNKIANILNISRSTWTGYEHGNYLISTILLKDLAKRYNRSMDYLLGKIDDKNALKSKNNLT